MNLKNYCATIYDGVNYKYTFHKAKSLNDAKEKGKEYIRANKMVGATVVAVTKIVVARTPLGMTPKEKLAKLIKESKKH